MPHMALVASTSTAGESANPEKILQNAIESFQSVLTEDERKSLRQNKAIPDEGEVMKFTAQLDACARSRRGRSIATRFYIVLESVRQFSAIIDTFVSANPTIAALVWGSVKFAIELVANYTSYFEGLSNLFMDLNILCPRFAEYQALYPTSQRLQNALYSFHASIIRCCKHAVEELKRPWQRSVLDSLLISFEEKFKSEREDIQKCSNEVREEIGLAKAQMTAQYQKLQAKEGNVAKIRMGLFSSQTKRNLESVRAQLVENESRERKQKLLDSLSSYDYCVPFRDACRKRHFSTAEWIFSTTEFDNWKNKNGSPVLWCSGKIGSGKTIIATSAIQHIWNEKSIDDQVAFFFLQYNNSESLKAETIMRSLIRQSLNLETLPDEIGAKLRKMEHDIVSDLDILTDILRQIIARSGSFYIFVDGLDECDLVERRSLLRQLSLLLEPPSCLRVFIASRESLSVELTKIFPNMNHISMASAEASSDLQLYIEEILKERRDNEDLMVRDPSVFEKVRYVLVQRANGMFLWATYLIQELCTSVCDDDILTALDQLPKSLEETFERALSRIEPARRSIVSQRIFPWLAVAKQHLTLDELCEAISIEIGDEYSKSSQLVNGIHHVVSWCENLVHIDEENKTVQFAHRSIYDFITEKCLKPEFAVFGVDIEEADHYAGEICVTYLHFNDFKTTLARRPRPGRPIKPADIAPAAFCHERKTSKAISSVISLGSKRHKTAANHDFFRTVARYYSANNTFNTFYDSHAFLRYAEKHWIYHTAGFRGGRSATWQLWQRILTEGHELAQRPWSGVEFNSSQSEALIWAHETCHYALIRLIDSKGGISTFERSQMMAASIAKVDVRLSDIYLRGDSACATGEVLQVAAKCGYLEIIERLLAANADVNATDHNGCTALRAAAQGGHLEIVKRLLAANADANATSIDSGGFTALHAAAQGGHLEIVKRLLAAKADANAVAADNGSFTALQIAAQGGHLEIVERLLAAKADANAVAADNGSFTALQIAAQGGYLEIVERLLAAKANVNTSNGLNGYTALQFAARGGHLEIVERLLAAKANVNTPNGLKRYTALQFASQGGYLEVVERLLAAKANVNTPGGFNGYTALQYAAQGGYLEIIERLLAAKANVNTPDGFNGYTALQFAAQGGHLEIIERLLAAKANVNTLNGFNGYTALQFAAQGGHLEIVKQLLAAKANVNTPDSLNGYTALQFAAQGGYLEVVERLLAAKANVNTPDGFNGYTALQYAAQGGHLEIVERLLAANADVNAAAARLNGHTALQAAAKGGHLEIVERLKDAGGTA